MADVKAKYGATTAIVITLGTPLASGGARECTAIDNSTNLFLDALIDLQIKLAAGTTTPAPDGGQARIDVYAYGSVDGTTFSDNATGSDAGVTMRSPTNLVLLGSIYTPTSGALTYKGHFNVSQAFGGVLPAKWGIVIVNQTALAFDSTEGSHTKQYRGVYATVT